MTGGRHLGEESADDAAEKEGSSQRRHGGSVLAATRRMLLKTTAAVGAVGLPALPARAQEATERSGDSRTGSTVVPEAFGDDLVAAMSTTEFGDAVTSVTFDGITDQAAIYSTPLHGLPVDDDGQFVVLSSGDATNIVGSPTTFSSVAWENGNAETDYSPDGYDAFDIVDIELEFVVPEGAEGFAFDFKFATEESPSYLGSQFQDFFEVQLFEPDNTVENIALIDGDPVTVDEASEVSNVPGGSSPSPEPPFPDSPDTVFNAVTNLRTVSRDVSNFQGETLGLVFRVADASDRVYDTAVFLDNLRFIGDVGTDFSALKKALDSFEASYKKQIRAQHKAEAHYLAVLYDGLGEEYAELLTNFWGYRAGEVPEEQVPEDLLAVLDSSIQTISDNAGYNLTEETAKRWYDFYTELFAVLSTLDDLESYKQAAYQFWVGTHPDQTVYLLSDGTDTVGTLLDEAWNIGESTIDYLTSQYAVQQSQVQWMTQGVSKIAKKFDARAEKIVENKVTNAELLLNSRVDGTVELHGTRVNGTESEGVDPEIGFVGSVLLVGAAIAGAYLGAYAIVKCLGAGVTDVTADAIGFEGVEVSGVDIGLTEIGVIDSGINLANWSLVMWDFATFSDEEIESEITVPGAALKGFKDGGKDLIQAWIALAAQWAAATEVEASVTGFYIDDVSGEKKMGLLDSVVDFFEGIWNFFTGKSNKSAPTVGEAFGELTISNEGPIPFTPKFRTDYVLIDGTSPTVGGGTPVVISGNADPLYEGDERTFDVTCTAPIDAAALAGRADVELGFAPDVGAVDFNVPEVPDFLPLSLCELDFYAFHGDTDTAAFSINDTVETVSLANESVPAGESKSFPYQFDGDTTNAVIDLSYEDHYSDLHLYDPQGNHVGYNYDGKSVDLEIPGASYSGRDTGTTNNEWITFSPESGVQYTIEVRSPNVGTVIQSASVGPLATSIASSFALSATAVPDLPPALSVTPSTLEPVAAVERGEQFTVPLVFTEVYGEKTAENVTVAASPLQLDGGPYTLAAENVDFDQNGISVESTATVETTISVPETAAEGTYTGSLEVTSSNATPTSVDVVFPVSVTPADFANESGIVTTDGLRTAIDEWRTGLIETDTLRAVIDVWRTGEPVESD